MGKDATGDLLLLADATVKIRWSVGGTQCLHEGCQAVGQGGGAMAVQSNGDRTVAARLVS
jgi:hypothetical protein